MEEDVDATSRPAESGVTLARDGVLTTQGRNESFMDIDNTAEDSDIVMVRARRRQKWAVGVQPLSTRPAACKTCGVPFNTGEIRLTTWVSRT